MLDFGANVQESEPHRLHFDQLLRVLMVLEPFLVLFFELGVKDLQLLFLSFLLSEIIQQQVVIVAISLANVLL